VEVAGSAVNRIEIKTHGIKKHGKPPGKLAKQIGMS
jgi:hypothetical protein